MQAVDFKYNGKLLSDIGMEIVHFNSSTGFDSSSAGSVLTVNTVPRRSGKVHSVVDAHYDDVFAAEIDICKPDGATITLEEYRYIMRWLNCNEYHELVIMTDIWSPIHFYGTFKEVSKVEHRGRIVGFTLAFTSNAPFGWGDQITESFDLGNDVPHIMANNSDETGDVVFDTLTITCHGDGDLVLTNRYDGRATVITGCKNGEVITINGNSLVVTSSRKRNVYDAFNFIYPQLVFTNEVNSVMVPQEDILLVTKSGDELITSSGDNIILGSRVNLFTASIPCSVVATYTPVRKVVF